MIQSQIFWLLLALGGSFAVGYYPFYMNVVFLSSYYIYSAPPLRLKQLPVISSFLISIAILVTIRSGFFFLSSDKKLLTFPLSMAMGIVLVFTMGVNVRDIKDIEGDRAEGVKTLTVVLGRYGVPVTALLFGGSFLLVPWVFHEPRLFIMAIPAALAGAGLAMRKPYREQAIFILYFVALFLGIGLMAL